MTLRRIRQWLTYKWQGRSPGLVIAYRITFQSMYGQIVLQDLLDQVYCTVCESNDPIALAAHNAQRAVVHNILSNIDIAEHPGKYEVNVVNEESGNGVATGHS